MALNSRCTYATDFWEFVLDRSMHTFHLEDNQWQLLEVRGQVPRLEHGCTATGVGDRIVVIGGRHNFSKDH